MITTKDREDQVKLFRLITGHNRLNSHMHRKLKLMPSSACSCQRGKQTAEPIFKVCQRFCNLCLFVFFHGQPPPMKSNWPNHENQDDWLHVWYLFYTQMQSIWCSHRPRAAWAGKSRPEGKTIPISGGTPTYLYCTELISQLKQINKPGKCILTSPFLWLFLHFTVAFRW